MSAALRVSVWLMLIVAWSGFVDHAGSLAADDRLQFNRDIRPILSDACFQCHGPDAKKRQADLRLDLDDQLFVERDGKRMLVPREPAKSEVFRRMVSDDPDQKMPPPDSGKALKPEQIAILRRWIEQGAQWESHWSLVPVQRPTLPEVGESRERVRHPLDRFVLAKLRGENLASSPEADRATLLRRVTLDLTGLPPSIDEIEDFLRDDSPAAYERVVDRLLASPRFGERFARPWLDAARYADTSGYQSDGERVMWRWRDWVIDALNDNKPFDEFTIEQLAGDLLPHASLEQVLATGFNRNHRGNAEGGIIPEEYAVEYVVDRVDTTATVWLGLTLGCCRCHDHKYDVFTQQEYYQLFAFFNNVPEKGRAIKFGNSPPMVKTPTREQQRQLDRLSQRLNELHAEANQQRELTQQAFADWERSLAMDFQSGKRMLDWTIHRAEILHLPFDKDGQPTVRLAPASQRTGSTPTTLGPNSGPPAVKPADQAAVVLGPGRLGQGATFDGQRRFAVGDVANFGFHDPLTLTAWIWADASSGTILSRMSDDANSDGYNLCLDNGKLQFNLTKRWLDDALRVETVAPIPLGEWVHVAVIYDGSRFANGVQFFVNGRSVEPKILLDELNQAFASKDVFRVGFGGLTPSFQGRVDEVRVFDAQLSSDEVAIVSVPDSVSRITAMPTEARTAAQQLKLRECFLSDHAPPDIREAHREIARLNNERQRMIREFPTTMVMEEMRPSRETHVLIRGVYDRPGEKVSANVPAAFRMPLPDTSSSSTTRTRLEFARWLMDRRHPLPSRVTVNRFWQQLFGQGIVKTVDDFGSQGDWPSHPELLDWLAAEFMNGPSEASTAATSTPRVWDVKRLIRAIVTSATYRQSSNVSAEGAARDPENRWLARGPRTRLAAEMVRDQALFASGLLTERLGGPSIKPYQPEGLWDDLQNTEKYEQDHGSALYRRGLYVFWKRTIAPPVMVTFDAAGRETCFVRESRTNTPLQALTLLNEVGFVEAARQLAERTMREAGTAQDQRVRFAFRAVLTREPNAAEFAVLQRGVQRHLDHYRARPAEAAALLRTGESTADSSLDPVEVAAWTAISGLILNLDEAITKE